MLSDDALLRAAAGLADRFGEDRAASFGRGLPALVTDLCERWDLQVEGVFDSGASSVVLAVESAASGPAALKISPDVAFVRRQVGMLRHLGTTGRTPVVLATDDTHGAMLLERIVPGTTVDSVGAAPPTPLEWATLLRDLHGTRRTGVAETLDDRCAEMLDRIGRRQQRPHVREHVQDPLWERTVQSCLDLLQTDQAPVVIHGDLHLGNVLDGGERGLVVIDPKLCVGDPCFDMVDYVIAHGDASQMIDRARELSRHTGTDLDRLLAWTRVNAVVTTVSLLSWDAPGERSQELLSLATSA